MLTALALLILAPAIVVFCCARRDSEEELRALIVATFAALGLLISVIAEIH